MDDSVLLGFTVGITASRRRDELRKAFEKRGAKVVVGSSIEIVPLERDEELKVATRTCITENLDYVVATTGIGFRGWIEAADGWGYGDALREALGRSTLLARGPKARGAIRACGLREAWTPTSESMSEVLEYLLQLDLCGTKIALQQHGEPLPDAVEALTAAGAYVTSIPVYRWELPEDISDVKRLVDLAVLEQVDCITFTSAPAVLGLLKVASMHRMENDLLDKLRASVAAICVGPVCAAPLERRGVPTLTPTRARLGSLIHLVAEQLPLRCSRVLPVAGHELQLRGQGVLLENCYIPVQPTPMAVLRILASEPGRVRTRLELAEAVQGEEFGSHALDMTVARLRSTLGDPRIVQTVVKRGYRLAYSPESQQTKYLGEDWQTNSCENSVGSGGNSSSLGDAEVTEEDE